MNRATQKNYKFCGFWPLFSGEHDKRINYLIKKKKKE